MTAVTKLEAEMEMFPILKNHFSDHNMEESSFFTTEVPLPFDEGHSSIFFSKHYDHYQKYTCLYFYDKNGLLLLKLENESDNTKSVEKNILELLAVGCKVTHLIRTKKDLLQLYVVPDGCDSVADIMIPMLAKERQKAKDALQKKIAGLYKKAEITGPAKDFLAKQEQKLTGNPGIDYRGF